MNEYEYIVIYDTDNFAKFKATSVYSCIKQFAEYTGCWSYLFEMAIASLSKDKDFIDMYNHFSNYSINAVYRVDKVIYTKEK